MNGLLRTGEDGTRFIDYLGASENEFEAFEDYLSFIGRHAALIRQNLVASHRPAIRRKYLWLARYHNDIVSQIRMRFETGELSADNFIAIVKRDASAVLDELVLHC
ncbi:hypothetical protein [Rhizobium binae]|uniref:hypothetical protein n=1 Tax=Rhizobium binae TaxID=1138190 RepID=UPI003DA87D04